MILYIGIAFYILVIGLLSKTINNKKVRKVVETILTLFPLFLLAAFRKYNIGNDTNVYLNLFYQNEYAPLKEYNFFESRYEIGYLLFNKLILLFTNNGQVFLITTSIFIYLGIAFLIIKYSECPWLSSYLFFTMGYFSDSMNTIRLCMAMTILLFSYIFIEKKRFVPFLLLVLMAACFHRTALVFIIAYFAPFIKLNKKTVLVIILLTAIIFLGFAPILEFLLSHITIYQYYIGSDYLNGDIRLASVMNALVMLCVFVMCMILLKISNQNNTNINIDSIPIDSIKNDTIMALFTLVATALLFISFNFSLIEKAGNYFGIFSIILLPNCLRKVKNQYLRVLLIMIILVLFLMYFVVIQIYRPEWNHIYPYQFYWKN